jgi:nondiscriminating aspartyl-tRNA synthetase
MERTLAFETPKKIGKEVLVKGWVNARRDHGKIIFIDLRDRTGIVQIVGGNELERLRSEWAVAVTGLVRARPEAMINPGLPTGTVEIEVETAKVLAKAKELPFDLGREELKLELPTLLDYRGLTLRHPKIKAIFRVQEEIIDSFRKTLKAQGFTEFQAPTIVPVATEGGSEIFPVEYFKYHAFLGQSPQLYKQIMVGVYERVFAVARAYRAEPSVTTRHLCEYISLDAELGFIDSYRQIMDVVELLFRNFFEDLRTNCSRELKLFKVELPKVANRIPQIKMREAQEIIFERTRRDNRKEPDLTPEDEKEICKWALEEKDSDLIFITHFPTEKRPFYTYPDPEDPEYTLSFDLLGKGLEWVTGGQRINDYDKLVANITARGNKKEDFKLYLQAFEYGMPPEGGFALGAERITMQILNLENIREASLFPRDMERIDVCLAKIKQSKN